MDDVSAQIRAFGIVNSLLSECIGVEVSSEVFNLETQECVPSSMCARISGSRRGSSSYFRGRYGTLSPLHQIFHSNARVQVFSNDTCTTDSVGNDDMCVTVANAS